MSWRRVRWRRVGKCQSKGHHSQQNQLALRRFVSSTERHRIVIIFLLRLLVVRSVYMLNWYRRHDRRMVEKLGVVGRSGLELR